MSVYVNRSTMTLVAAADLTAKQFNAVKIDSNGQAALAVLGDAIAGVLLNNPAAGQSATIQLSGVTKGKAGGTIAAGAAVTPNASGVFIAATTGNYIAGYAKEAAVSGDTFAILLKQNGKF